MMGATPPSGSRDTVAGPDAPSAVPSGARPGSQAPAPLLLALDTSGEVGSVAVARGGRVLARGMVLDRREQAARLVPAIRRVLEEAGVGRQEVDGLVVGRGPGSFTGVRIAAATARGIAMALGCPVWAWSSLAGAAASHGADIPDALRLESDLPSVALPEDAVSWPRYVLFDARADRVYAGCYRFPDGGMEELRSPEALTVDELLARELPGDTLFCGSGALAHAELLDGEGFTVLPYPAGLPTAEGLLRVHLLHPGASPLDPGSRWEPEYLRVSSAERESRGRLQDPGVSPSGSPEGAASE
jgi:tRNA threonylcarbamoyl adenosine modification protein YeaZ